MTNERPWLPPTSTSIHSAAFAVLSFTARGPPKSCAPRCVSYCANERHVVTFRASSHERALIHFRSATGAMETSSSFLNVLGSFTGTSQNKLVLSVSAKNQDLQRFSVGPLARIRNAISIQKYSFILDSYLSSPMAQLSSPPHCEVCRVSPGIIRSLKKGSIRKRPSSMGMPKPI